MSTIDTKASGTSGLRPEYIQNMRAHVDENGTLSHRNGVDLLAEVERLQAAAPQPAPDAGEPVAWIDFTDHGRIRFWTHDSERAAREIEVGRHLRMFTLAELVSLAAMTATPAQGVLRELEAKAEIQKTYFNEKQHKFPSLEDFTDRDGKLSLPDDITPLLNQAEANGRYSEADWWLTTIRAVIAAAPARCTAPKCSCKFASDCPAEPTRERAGKP